MRSNSGIAKFFPPIFVMVFLLITLGFNHALAEPTSVLSYGKPGRHRLTGRMQIVDPKGGVFTVSGRRKTLRFTVDSEILSGFRTGEKVRVFYKVGDDKKVVVLRLKKVNNVNASVGKSSGSGRKRIED